MKSIFSLIIIASLLFVACNDNNDHDSVSSKETQSVFLKFNPSTNSRASESSASGQSAQLLSAVIYFLDNATDPVVYAIRTVGDYDDANATITELTDGVEFDGIPSSVTQIYIVGNFNSSDADDNTMEFPMASGVTLSTIQKTILNIQEMAYGRLNETDYNELLTILDGSADIVDYDSNPTGWTAGGGQSQPASGDYYAIVAISPINARIEIKQLAYTGTLTSFEVEGIYVNYYYADMPLSLLPSASGVALTDNGSTTDNYDSTHSNFAYTNYSTLYDEVEESVIPVGNQATINPATEVWAYHVFGNQDPVHIIIKFTDVIDADLNDLGNKYLTIKGFRDSTNTELTTLTRGNIYQIDTLEFSDDDLQVLPETENINIWVQVEVTPWTTVPVTPVF